MDLADNHTTPEEKYHQMAADLYNAPFNPGCAWCRGIGVYEEVERFVPGEQVKKI